MKHVIFHILVFGLLLHVPVTAQTGLPETPVPAPVTPSLAPGPAAGTDPRISSVVLNHTAVQDVAVGVQAATTFHFPVPVTAVLGYGLTGGDDGSSSFQFANPEEMPQLLVVRALEEGKLKEAVMTVALQDRLFLFRLVRSAQPQLLVNLEGGGKQEWDKPRFEEVTPADTVARRIDFDERRLLTLLRMARSWGTLKEHYPGWFEGADRRTGKMEMDFGKVKTVITEAVKFRKDDAMVLLGFLENRTGAKLYYDPSMLHVAVGEREYPVRLAEAVGEIEPKAKAQFAVVIQGDSTGGRAHLSIKNDLRLIPPEVSESPVSGPPAVTEGNGVEPDAALLPVLNQK